MSDAQSKRTIPSVIAIGILCLAVSGCAQSAAPEEPIATGRYQIVSQPSGPVLRINTHDGRTSRLVVDPENGTYYWGVVNE